LKKNRVWMDWRSRIVAPCSLLLALCPLLFSCGYERNDPHDIDVCGDYIDMGTYYIMRYEASKSGSVACSRKGAMPWVNVTWDEAKAACEAAGSRLCNADEWGDACDGVKGSGGSVYPYGNTYSGSTCNGSDAGKGGAVPTGSMSGCVSGFGAYDMSGNVWEWTNEASGSNRVIRGGSFYNDSDGLGCASRYVLYPALSDGYFGFRCCQDK